MRLTARLLLLFVLFLTMPASSSVACATESAGSGITKISPGPNARFELQEALILATPGDVIELQAGTYHLQSEINIACDNLTIRGAGPEKTILSFRGQNVGANGIISTGNATVLEDLAVEDTAGNAIKVLGARDVTFRRVRVEWTDGPKPTNGAYGIYPVECRNVLIEGCSAECASDAGIYVGQCQDVIVRNCTATRNVAGIEIENTLRADVYNNKAFNNTGGILVFDLPGLTLKNGGQVRIYDNQVTDNNHENFASAGTMVADVPSGTGIMLMATDHVEIFRNSILDHNTSNVVIVSFLATQRKLTDREYDPYPEAFSIHDNQMRGAGKKPGGQIGMLLSPVLGLPFPDIFYDGITDSSKLVDGVLPENLTSSIRKNGDITFTNVRLDRFSPVAVLTGEYQPLKDLSAYAAKRRPLPEVVLQPHATDYNAVSDAAEVYLTAPALLSEWNLLTMLEGRWQPTDDLLDYELNTPLFSDYTLKHRWIRLPAGQSMLGHPERTLQFPVGTVIAKTFAYPDERDDATEGERWLETRISTHRSDGWYGYSYIWDEEQTEARLSLGGGELEVIGADSSGRSFLTTYQVPNANQCLSCHSQNGRFEPLGPTVRNLNRAHAGTGVNQLMQWQTASRLKDLPAGWEHSSLAAADSTDPTAHRARAWLEVNCAHCHNPEGSARTSGLDLRTAQSDPAKFGLWKSPVAAGKGSGGRRYDIVPGKPDESILMYRIETEEPGARMPSLARSLVHSEGAELIRRWIQEMPAERKAK